MGRWKTARRGRSEKDDGAFGCAESSKEGGVSGWVGTAGGLWALRLNAPSRWFLASQAKITICKTKTHRSNLRSPEGAGAGLLVLSVMATCMEQTACQVRERPRKGLETPGGHWKNRQALPTKNKIRQVRCAKTHGAGATFCPASRISPSRCLGKGAGRRRRRRGVRAGSRPAGPGRSERRRR